MSDFLHNLRSGKFKRNDRNNRSYNDPHYRGSHKRNDNDRRKGSRHQPAAAEQLTDSVKNAFAEIKNVLEDIAANQKRLADAYESTVKAHDRKADAMESIAEILKQHLASSFESVADKQGGLESRPQANILADNNTPLFSTENLDREQVHEQILSLRENGTSYDKIAQHLESNGVPTFSGKGKWRGQTVSKLCKQI